MSFPPLFKLFNRGALRFRTFFVPRRRRRVAFETAFVAAFLFIGASLCADDARLAQNVDCADDARLARNVDCADDAIPLFGASSNRPALFCSLAGIPTDSVKWDDSANWETPLPAASSLQTSRFAAFAPLTLESQTAQSLLIPDVASTAQPLLIPDVASTAQSLLIPDVASTAQPLLIPDVASTAQSLLIPDVASTAQPLLIPDVVSTAQPLLIPDVASTAQPLLIPDVASTAPTASPIIRGGYISNLPIAPFRGRVFAYADGSWGRQAEQSADPFESGFDVATFGGGVGQDWRLSKNAIWGIGFQGRNIQLNPAAEICESEIDSLAGFLRLSLFGPLWRLDLSLGAAKNWNEQRLSAQDVTKFSSSQWNYEAEFGVRFDKGYTRVEPLVNLRILTLSEPAEAERRFVGLGRPNDYSDASYRLKLGSRFSWEYATHLATLKPYLTATWAHEFGDRALYTVGENTPFPIAYRYARHKMARDRLDLGGGLDAALRETVDVFFRYDVEFAKEYTNYLFYAGFHKKF